MARLNIFPLLLLIALILAAVSCFRDGSNDSKSLAQGGAESAGGQTSGDVVRPSTPAAKVELPPITDFQQILTATNAQSLWTRSVNISGVPVQRVSADKQFIFVGPNAEHAVVIQMQELHPEIKRGQSVDVDGVINHLGQDVSQWNVSPEDRQMLNGRSIYIRATTVRSTAVK